MEACDRRVPTRRCVWRDVSRSGEEQGEMCQGASGDGKKVLSVRRLMEEEMGAMRSEDADGSHELGG